MSYRLVFDIGGTNTRFALIGDGYSTKNVTSFSTKENLQDNISEIMYHTHKSVNNNNIIGIAGGIAGTLNQNKTHLLHSPNLKNYTEHNITLLLSRFCPNASIFLENDASMVGLGEAIYGAGRGSNILAYLTISTGIGGSRIVNQSIDLAHHNFEPGHQIIDYKTGLTLHDVASGASIKKRFGKEAKEVVEQNVWEEVMKYIAIGVHNTILFWSPDTIVLGGGIITDLKHLSIGKIVSHIENLPSPIERLPRIVISQLDSNGGIIGAEFYLDQKIKSPRGQTGIRFST